MPVINGYCSVDELKAELEIPDQLDDLILEQIINAVSRAFEKPPAETGGTGRRFYTVAETRYFTPLQADRCYIDDAVAVTAVATDDDEDGDWDTVWAAGDYTLWPYNAAKDGEPYTRIDMTPRSSKGFAAGSPRSVAVTGSFGYSATTPEPVKRACLLQCNRIFGRRNAIFGVVGSAELGQLQVVPRLDPDVAALLAGYRRRRW